MAHKEQRDFFEIVRASMPHFFHGVRALDCGSLDVNGSLRDLFDATTIYIGVDLRPGRNVSIVSHIHRLPIEDGWFDTVLSAEMLEHDEHWAESLRRMYAVLRVGGLLAFSAATTGRPEHGTVDKPDVGEDPPDGVWGSSPRHYRNITAEDIAWVFSLEGDFASHAFGVNEEHHDLYFWGIKR